MERRKSALTPEQYARAIIALSRRYASNSTFPGNNYVGLGEWVLQDRSLFNTTKSEDERVLFVSQSEKPHDLVVVYNSGARKWEMQQYSQEQHQAFSLDTTVPARGSGQLVFIRGFISPSWVTALGSKYNIDPEYFRQHMDFLSASVDRHAYSFPSLSSSSNNIIRLCVSTLVHRDDFGGQDIQSQRSHESAQLATYRMHSLGSNRVSCGDSIVREYSTICPSFSVMEQWISISISKTDRGWAVIAWMDQGRPLEESPPGPWLSHIESKAIALPVLQSHHKMAFRTTTNRLDSDANASARFQQSAAVLPLQYDSLIALVDLARRAPQDPLHMCIPLFAHAAFSEVQFLNLMGSKICAQTDTIVEGVSANTLETFQYFGKILNRHAQQLKDTLRALQKLVERSDPAFDENRSGYMTKPGTAVRPGPGADLARQVETKDAQIFRGTASLDGSFTAKGLLEDYEQLLDRCIELSKTCNRGITLAMNKATIEESRKAIEQSERLKKLTILATLFIPLNFSSSLFGMNIEILGQGHLAFWWFLVLCVPITLLAYIFYLWDFQALRNQARRLWRMCYSLRSNRRAKWIEKDDDHVV
ncbi:hypothetical protein NPX13_g352 [Xylaria arbuscula]|uniref:Uncharacterized protein n=1 Tax=Xylaria arbuscula TaxID=114810 RepID=A0A9W8NPC8_9PEZI|nr:hypothetical protein NPX13_g352 [Xylaria arbuscula]